MTKTTRSQKKSPEKFDKRRNSTVISEASQFGHDMM